MVIHSAVVVEIVATVDAHVVVDLVIVELIKINSIARIVGKDVNGLVLMRWNQNRIWDGSS